MRDDSNEHTYLTVDNLSEYLGIPVDTIYGWRTKGYGPVAFKVGRHLRYRLRDIESWLDSRAGI